MTLEWISRNWALVAAAALATGIGFFVVLRLSAGTSRGLLRQQVKNVRQRYAQVVRAHRNVVKAEHRLAKLTRRAESTKPRLVSEAGEALEDARALLKIAQDQVLVAENHVRKVIVEEFPPARQQALRDRYLQRPEPDKKPFTF
jgi:hypothetical protein